MKNFKTIVLIAFAGLLMFSCSKKETQEVPVGKVKKGTLYLDIFETGEVQAIQSTNLITPNISWRYGTLKITQIVKDGTIVKKGDTVIVFDPSEVRKAIVDAEARMEISNAELERLKAQQESDLEDMKSDYEVTKISQEISKIQFESANYEADIKKKEIQLNLEKANIALKRSKEQIDNMVKIQAEEMKQKRLSIEQDRTRLRESYETLDKLNMVSTSPGIAIISRNWNSGNKFQVGDQCWSGYPIIQLPDMSTLKATVQINEVDITKIRKGQRVEIKPDAFSDSIYAGEVMSIANLATNKDGNSKIKVFPVEILIKETSGKLLPGLTVSCRILVDKIDNIQYLPVDAIRKDVEGEFVYVKSGSGFKRVNIETGASNTDYVVVTKGVEEGDVVALIDPLQLEKDKKNKKEDKK